MQLCEKYVVAEAERIRKKHPGTIPVVVHSKDGAETRAYNFIVPENVPLFVFMTTVRKHVPVNSFDGVYLLDLNGKYSPGTWTIGDIFKNVDGPTNGFLHLCVRNESAFG